MEQEHDQVKQQSERQLQELEKRRALEQKRADFYAKRRRELEEAFEARKRAKEDAKEKQQKLREQMMRCRRFVKERDS